MYVRIGYKGDVAKIGNIFCAENVFLHRNRAGENGCRHPVSYFDGPAELTIGNATTIEFPKDGQNEIGRGNLAMLEAVADERLL